MARQFMWTMSDRAIPRSYRMMQGFGVNTWSLVNSKGERHFVKFHWTPDLGVWSMMWDEALKLGGQDPDFHRKDLYEAIENGMYPKWSFGIQVIPESREDDFDFDVLDSTKVWPEDQIPVRYIGEMTLNRNPDEYFTQTEQVAFCTSHIVPGIDFSDDPLLQGRNFSYFDTQISRLGINWEELPINRPVCPVLNFNRDGQGRHTITRGKVNYWPNRFEATPPAPPSETFQSYPDKYGPSIKARMLSKKFGEHLSQAQLFYNSLTPVEKAHQTAAFGFELDHCDEPIVYERMCERLAEIDLALAKAVAEQVGAPTPQRQSRPNHGKTAPRLSQFDFAPAKPTIATRRIAILIADGYDEASYNGIKAVIKFAGALSFTIGPRRQPIKTSEGKEGAQPDHHFNGQRSTMFDALFVPDGNGHSTAMIKNGLCRHWVREAFMHLKAIGAVGDGIDLVQAALKEVEDVKLAGKSDSGVTEWYGVVTAPSSEAKNISEKVEMKEDATDLVGQFFWQISRHRNFAREMDGLASQVAA